MTHPLEPAEYWQLRALSADLDRAQAEAALAEARVALARQRRAAYWAALAGRHALAVDRVYGALDESCALVEASDPVGA